MSLTDKAWEILFDRHNILQNVEHNGFFEITAKEIKREREPRLMAKFDHYSNLPKIFKENSLAILPNSRSSYVIGEFDVYEKVNYDSSLKPIHIDFPSSITTIDPSNLYSESSALHCAYVTGMIDDILGEKSHHTISGRMSSKEFGFNITTKKGTNHPISIKNSQIEIDGGYESQSKFMIIEAKNEKVDDFLVRQLYYPYRLWQTKINKVINPVFFTYSNDIFSFFVYEFTEQNNYNSIKLIEQKDYIIAHEKLTLDDLKQVLLSVDVRPEPFVPFPQADSFPRIVDLLGLLAESDLTKDYITSNYNFDERQTSYYTTAGIYLGLIEKYTAKNKQVMFTLTETGREIMSLSTKYKYLRLAKEILAHAPFNQVLKEFLQTDTLPSRERILEIMKRSNLFKVNSDSTYNRRASTLISWSNWILSLPEKY